MRHIPHLYLPPPWEGATIELTQQQQHHLGRVLRRLPGTEVTYTDGKGTMGYGRLSDSAVIRGDEDVRLRPEPAIRLAVAPITDKVRSRFLVEKLAELGVDELAWMSSRTAHTQPPRAARVAAWAVAALEQSRGAWLMTVGECVSLDEMDAARLVVAERGNPLPLAVVDSDIIVVGPPGGFEADEIPGGVRRIGLGKRVLRVETAAITAAVLGLERAGRLDITP